MHRHLWTGVHFATPDQQLVFITSLTATTFSLSVASDVWTTDEHAENNNRKRLTIPLSKNHNTKVANLQQEQYILPIIQTVSSSWHWCKQRLGQSQRDDPEAILRRWLSIRGRWDEGGVSGMIAACRSRLETDRLSPYLQCLPPLLALSLLHFSLTNLLYLGSTDFLGQLDHCLWCFVVFL